MTNKRVFISVGIVLAISYMSLAFLDPDPPGANTVRLCYFIGSLYAHASLAAAWAALGPGKLKYRLPLSGLWVLALPIAIAVNLGLHGGPQSATLQLGVCLFGLWLTIQLVLAAIVWWTGLRIKDSSDSDSEQSHAGYQFRIFDLLVLITTSAVLFAVGRAVVPLMKFTGDSAIFIFLAVAAVIIFLPLLLAALLERYAVLGVLLSLLLLIGGAYIELPLLKTLGGRGPSTSDLIAINAASAVLILVVAGIVRMHGYCLYLRRRGLMH